MKWLLVPILGILCFMLSGCGNDDSTSPDKTTYIYPLTIGNSWLTETIYYNQQGAEISRDTSEMTVAKDTVIQSERWFQFADDSVLVPGFVANRLGGFWVYDPRHLAFQYPTEEGTMYTGPSNSVTEVEHVADTVQVSAGQFICHTYKKTTYATDDFFRNKLAPGVGLIVSEVWRDDGSQLYLYSRSTLLEYSVQ